MFVMQDIFDPVTDNQVAEHIMALHRRQDNIAYGTKLSQGDLARYIKLAQRVNPRITKPAHDCLVRCYKSLRENKGDRGAAGVTVRQLESLVRLSEAVARVHLDPEVKREYVEEAFRLQNDTLRRAQRENIDLTPEAPETDVTDAVAGDGGDMRAPKKLKVTWAEYQRIGQMLAKHLHQQSDEGRLVSEESLIGWYMEQREEVLQTEAQLFQEQNLVQLIINRMIDKDRVLVVYKQSEDHDHPEQRILVKHPNFQVGELIAGSKSLA